MKRFIDIDQIKKVTKEMPMKEKMQYIRQYYWIPISVVILAIVMVVYIGYHTFFTVKDYWFFILYTNTREDVGNGSELWKEYVEITKYDTKKKMVEFNNNSYFDASISGGTNNSYYQSFVAFVESKTLDAVVGSVENLSEVGSSGRLLDLDSEVCTSIKEKYQDRFIYCVPYDEEYERNLVPVAIDLTDSRLMTEYQVYQEGETCALGISEYAQHLDAVEAFLDMVCKE